MSSLEQWNSHYYVSMLSCHAISYLHLDGSTTTQLTVQKSAMPYLLSFYFTDLISSISVFFLLAFFPYNFIPIFWIYSWFLIHFCCVTATEWVKGKQMEEVVAIKNTQVMNRPGIRRPIPYFLELYWYICLRLSIFAARLRSTCLFHR